MAAIASSSTKHPQMARPAVKRSSHTWPRVDVPRNHFEDFMLEIGSPAHSCQLCCVPRPATKTVAHPSHKRSASAPHSLVNTTSDSFIRPSHSRRNSSDANPRSSSTHRSAWFSLGTAAASSERKVSRFPVGTLVKTGAMSRLFKSDASASVDTGPCLLDSSVFNYSDLLPASARASLRALLGDDTPDNEDQDAVMTEMVEACDEMTHDSPPSTSPTSDADAGLPARPLSRSASFDSLTTANSSIAPATPRTHSPLLGELSPALAELEHSSRFRVDAVCITCKRTGSNFPSCGRCGEQWCSRDCRLKGGAGRRHDCSSSSRSRERAILTEMI